MFDQHFDDALAEWLAGFDAARKGDHEYYDSFGEWLDDHRPPHRDSYRPWKDDDATWFQVWETVSEGTPVTPPFATKEELVTYLVDKGDLWQQKRWAEGNTFMQPNPPGYSRAAAEAFVESGWAPSMVVSGGKVSMGIDVPLMLKNEPG